MDWSIGTAAGSGQKTSIYHKWTEIHSKIATTGTVQAKVISYFDTGNPGRVYYQGIAYLIPIIKSKLKR